MKMFFVGFFGLALITSGCAGLPRYYTPKESKVPSALAVTVVNNTSHVLTVAGGGRVLGTVVPGRDLQVWINPGYYENDPDGCLTAAPDNAGQGGGKVAVWHHRFERWVNPGYYDTIRGQCETWDIRNADVTF